MPNSGSAACVLYGGTFDPVHSGHLAVAEAAVAALDADVALIPSADPPHRAPPGASGEQRARMLELALAGHPRLHVDRREKRRPGPSYSIDTLDEVRAEVGPGRSLVWLLGADAFAQLHRWHRWRELFARAHLAIATRPDHALDALAGELQEACAGRWTRAPADLLDSPNGRLFVLELPPRLETASSVRARIAAGQRWEGDLAPAVAAYIRDHGLYGRAET